MPTRKELIADGVEITPLTREEILLQGGEIEPLNVKEKVLKGVVGGGGVTPGGGIEVTQFLAKRTISPSYRSVSIMTAYINESGSTVTFIKSSISSANGEPVNIFGDISVYTATVEDYEGYVPTLSSYEVDEDVDPPTMTKVGNAYRLTVHKGTKSVTVNGVQAVS